ncbi:hypothetical protein [Streptomyces sp. VRA16 Mangrove soil]|uniref:hypothetical protein n=1 Tax=Streptomyces sp. VRA16 Mangrove soil TaxID=2817434 RepID=UPI001A9E78E3|nr:hypothetical protein [Streptomyces sp. VRA16 Mangrove soil]MBO1336455.1 hypothetical protein [Streptomyces sp. VRA16 Mangrove soil]
MKPPARSVVVSLLCAVGALVLAACGTQHAGAAGAGGTASATPARWQTYAPTDVRAARLAADGRTLTLTPTVPNVEGSGSPCYRNLKAVVTSTSDRTVWVQVTYETGGVPDCVARERTATVRTRLPAPLGKRVLSVDGLRTFTADAATAPDLRLCGELGCHPAPTGCTPASYDQAVAALDVPNHTSRGEEHCDGKWLVFDVSSLVGPACPKGAAPGCGASIGDRWFFRAEKSGWKPIARGVKGGCTDVHRIEPAFPAALCADLPPLRK